MTREEAIDTIRSNYPPSHYTMLCEALDMAMDVLKNDEKYRWHDLKKDPEDLPKEQLHQVLVKIEGSWNKHVKYDCGWIFDGSWFHVDGKVIAWREIKPFEVKE